jgi:hypothetical protein
MSRRLLWEDDVIKVIDNHTNDDNTLDNDISCILEEVDSGWIKCVPGQMPEDDERYKGRKVINVLVTTASGEVTKVQRMYDGSKVGWQWGRINSEPKAWMILPESYKEN